MAESAGNKLFPNRDIYLYLYSLVLLFLANLYNKTIYNTILGHGTQSYKL